MSSAESGKNGNDPQALASPAKRGLSGIELIAIVLSVLWLGAAVLFFTVVPGDDPTEQQGNQFIVTMMAVFLPVAMIWVAAVAARTARVMREESRRLQTAIEAIRQTQIAQQQQTALHQEPVVTRKLDEIAETTRKTESVVLTFQSARNPVASRPATSPASVAKSTTGDVDQASLELGTPADEIGPPLSTQDFIRALHFPETAEDKDGFAALRRALKDRNAALLIQAAQDVLTLLSQDGIYMDDLSPDKARPEIWRRFAQGTRGREISAMGGVHDRTSLALTNARIKQDPIFRDAVHHFLRRFDQMLAEFEQNASDEELSALGDTRTARAFMLVGRVSGTFN